jgi:creatinine amidohydrolase
MVALRESSRMCRREFRIRFLPTDPEKRESAFSHATPIPRHGVQPIQSGACVSPAKTLGLANFGIVSVQSNQPRQIQLSLRLAFLRKISAVCRRPFIQRIDMTPKTWKFHRALSILTLTLGAGLCSAQVLSPKWEDLASPDFGKAIQKASGVCVLPTGSIEKFGPAGPLGTNLYVIRIMALEAVKQEYAVVFPEYFVAQTTNVSNLPGAIAYSAHLQREMLEETTNEMARNGCKKILILNGHSGNMGMLTDFLSTEMSKPKDHIVYLMQGGPPRMSPLTEETAKLPVELRPSKPDADGHGGEERISVLLAYHPDLVHLDRAHDEPILPVGSHRLNLPTGVQAGVAAAKQAPTGYLGDASGATAKRGKALTEYTAARIAEAIRAIKADEESPRLQKEFFEKMLHPSK